MTTTVLEYPYDFALINRKKKSLKRKLSAREGLTELRLAVLGGSTTYALVEFIELFALKHGFKLEIYQSAFDQYFEEAMFVNERLSQFKPDLIYIHTTYRNITCYSRDTIQSNEDLTKSVEKEFKKFESIWVSLKEKYSCPIIQNNFDYPSYSINGIYDGCSIDGFKTFIDTLNQKFRWAMQEGSALLINDIHALSASLGLGRWHDMALWYGYKYAISYEAMPCLANAIGIHMRSLFSFTKKCLVLDLDDTLWGGVIGELGVDHIELGQGSASGEAYLEFQAYVVSLKMKGVILAVCSKNNKEIAIEGFNHPESKLTLNDFAVFIANWESKDLNIREIAKQLNIGLDSLVFIDDNPAERELVKKSLPMVEVPDVKGDVLNYIKYIENNGYFDAKDSLNEDILRNEAYATERKREELKSEFTDYDAYLRSLEMEAKIGEITNSEIKRSTQLINKTNQFNLTTKRVSEQDVLGFSQSKDWLAIYGQLKDKFGDSGIVSVILGEVKNNDLYLDVWVMSCRVFKRTLENSMFFYLQKAARTKKVKTIIGKYIPSVKNQVVKDLYKTLGFKKVEEHNNIELWCYNITPKTIKSNETIKWIDHD